MSNVEDQIRSRVEAFAAELAALVRRAAFDAVQASLAEPGDGGSGGAAPRRGRGRPPTRHAAAGRPAARREAARQASPAAPARRGAPARGVNGAVRRPGEKRDPRELARLVDRLLDYVKTNPGQRIEQINRALGVPTKDLTLPIKKLLVSNRITSKGEKRATSYWPK
jgi:hypothetical protein